MSSLAQDGPEAATGAKAAARPKLEPENQGAAFLLGGLTVVTGIFTALGVTGGIVGRMARNEATLTTVGLSLTVSAVVVGAVAAYVLRRDHQRRALMVGLGLLLAAGILAVLAGVHVWGDRTQPRLSASIGKSASGSVLLIRVRASSLHASDRLTVVVKPLLGVFEETPAGVYHYAAGGSLYRTSVGPNANGDIDASFRVSLVPGEYGGFVVSAFAIGNGRDDCYQRASDKACVTLKVAEAERPQLSASWNTGRTSRLLYVHLMADDIPKRTVSLRVVGAISGHRHRLLDEWSLAPDLNGDFRHTEGVPVPADVQRVCIVASTILRAPSCPPPRRLHVPHTNTPTQHVRLLREAQAATVWLRVRAP